MSEKTEQPTAKRLRDARRDGQVVKSQEVSSGLQLAALLLYFHFEGPALLVALQGLIDGTVAAINLPLQVALHQILGRLFELLLHFMGVMALLVTGVTVVGILAQIGPMLAPGAVKFSAKKLNPAANLKQIFSLKTVFEFLKSSLKVVLLALVFAYLLRGHATELQLLPSAGAGVGIILLARLIAVMWGALIAFYVVFAAADYAVQRHTVMKQLRMSKDEVKREHKDAEGNPEIKQKRRAQHREIQSGSLAARVAKSTVVIRNPTHVAICLYYQPDQTPLPLVLEKGEGALALRMVELAERAGVPTVENIPLARALLRGAEVDHYVPGELLEAVAHVLHMIRQLPPTGAPG